MKRKKVYLKFRQEHITDMYFDMSETEEVKLKEAFTAPLQFCALNDVIFAVADVVCLLIYENK